jgi:small conductance mechanosensitive channel
MNEQIETVDRVTATALDMAIRFGPRVAVALVILAVGYYLGRWAGGLTQRHLAQRKLEPPVVKLLVRIVKVVVLALFVILALQNLGVELLPLIAGVSIIGAGVALATQGVLGNLVAGLNIIFSRPFNVGQYIQIGGVEGRVEDVDLFNTTLSHPDRSTVVVPNRKIVGEILHNYGHIRQLEVTVAIAYDADLNRAFATLHEIMAASAFVLKDPAPVLQILSLSGSTVNIAAKPWVEVPDYGMAISELNRSILEMFRARDIAIPFQQRVVHIVDDRNKDPARIDDGIPRAE